jgi:beta-lactamase regulating signal transducer with metallopeptidase domain
MLWWFIETTLVAAALAGAVAVLCRRLRPRPAVRHALWLVVLLKLLTPPLLAWPWPAPAPVPLADEPTPRPPPAEKSIPTLPPAETTAAAPAVHAPWDAPPEAVPEPRWLPDDPAPVTAVPPAAVAASPPAERWAEALVVVWFAGAVLTALLQLVRILRFRLQVGRGRPAPASLAETVGELAARIGVAPPPVSVVPGLASPVVWGLGRPRLVWPAALLGRLSPDGERSAVVHELAHLRRRDHWVGWLELAASCVWWWSPLFWHVRRQVGRAAELACDAWVVEVLPAARRAYAEALLEVCELVSRRAAPAPALGMGGARPEIERRLTMILRESVPSRLPVRAVFGAVLLALIALPGLTDGQDAAPRNRTADHAPAKSAPVAFEQGQPATKAPADVAFPAAKAPADEREQRLQKLESTLEALLKEVRDLRGAAATRPATSSAKPATEGSAATREPDNVHRYSAETKGGAQKPAQAAEQPVHLCRVSYTLQGKESKEQAVKLAALLKDLKSPEVEVVVKDDSIVVTTTPEAQRAVGEFIGLLQGKVSAGKSAYYPNYGGVAK